MSTHLMIQGTPGSGKTTLIERIVEKYPDIFSGFFTKEVKEDKWRIGFDLVCINDNLKSPLARIGNNQPKVGKYEVYVDKFEEFLLRCDLSTRYIIIDEIGKMECLSLRFKKLLNELFREKLVVATIPVYNLPIITLLREKYPTEVFQLNKLNRDDVLTNSVMWIESWFGY